MEAGDQAVLNIQTKDYSDKNPEVTLTGFNEKQCTTKNEWTAGMNGYELIVKIEYSMKRSEPFGWWKLIGSCTVQKWKSSFTQHDLSTFRLY